MLRMANKHPECLIFQPICGGGRRPAGNAGENCRTAWTGPCSARRRRTATRYAHRLHEDLERGFCYQVLMPMIFLLPRKWRRRPRRRRPDQPPPRRGSRLRHHAPPHQGRRPHPDPLAPVAAPLALHASQPRGRFRRQLRRRWRRRAPGFQPPQAVERPRGPRPPILPHVPRGARPASRRPGIAPVSPSPRRLGVQARVLRSHPRTPAVCLPFLSCPPRALPSIPAWGDPRAGHSHALFPKPQAAQPRLPQYI